MHYISLIPKFYQLDARATICWTLSFIHTESLIWLHVELSLASIHLRINMPQSCLRHKHEFYN